MDELQQDTSPRIWPGHCILNQPEDDILPFFCQVSDGGWVDIVPLPCQYVPVETLQESSPPQMFQQRYRQVWEEKIWSLQRQDIPGEMHRILKVIVIIVSFSEFHKYEIGISYAILRNVCRYLKY